MTLQAFFSRQAVSRLAAVTTLTLGTLVGMAPVQAKVVVLSFSGSYVTLDTIFGQQGESLPYHYQLTYDTSLDTNDAHVVAGSQLGDYVTTHDWHGYSASGLIAANVSFGNKTWAMSDLQARLPAFDVSADLWFDTDINQVTPTRSWIYFQSAPGDLFATLGIGEGWSDGQSVEMTRSSVIMDDAGAYASSDNLTISAVPEPQALWFVPAGMLALLLCRPKRVN